MQAVQALQAVKSNCVVLGFCYNRSCVQGDILLVSQGDPLGDSQEAIVVDFSSRWIRLAMNPVAAAAVAAASGGWGRGSSAGARRWRPIWRLDLFANTVSHERCSEALHRFADAVTQQEGSDRQVLLSGQLTQGQLQQQEALCRVLAGALPAGKRNRARSASGACATCWRSTQTTDMCSKCCAGDKGVLHEYDW